MKTILISGAGSGIGRSTAIALEKSGHDIRLVLIGRNIKKLQETNSQLSRPDQHMIVPVETQNGKALRSAFAELGLQRKNLSAIIANAGIGGENTYGEKDRWSEIIETNLTGTYTLIQETLPLLRQSSEKYKHIVVVSSVLAHMGVPKYSAYCASKAGLLGLTRALAAEHAAENILVNAICPGWVSTEMAEQGIELMASNTGKSRDQIYQEQMSMIPLHKMSSPTEIGNFINFLISNQQVSITGQALNINNGSVMM